MGVGILDEESEGGQKRKEELGQHPDKLREFELLILWSSRWLLIFEPRRALPGIGTDNLLGRAARQVIKPFLPLYLLLQSGAEIVMPSTSRFAASEQQVSLCLWAT